MLFIYYEDFEKYRLIKIDYFMKMSWQVSIVYVVKIDFC